MTATPRIPADLRAAGEGGVKQAAVSRRRGPRGTISAAGFGCFHTLASDRRPAYVIGVSHVAAGRAANRARRCPTSTSRSWTRALKGPAMALPALVLVWPDLTTTPGTSPISGCGSPRRS